MKNKGFAVWMALLGLMIALGLAIALTGAREHQNRYSPPRGGDSAMSRPADGT